METPSAPSQLLTLKQYAAREQSRSADYYNTPLAAVQRAYPEASYGDRWWEDHVLGIYDPAQEMVEAKPSRKLRRATSTKTSALALFCPRN